MATFSAVDIEKWDAEHLGGNAAMSLLRQRHVGDDSAQTAIAPVDKQI
jgi:hypothetical protein